MIRRFVACVWLVMAVSVLGCAGSEPSAGSQRARNAERIDQQRILVPARPPRIIVNDDDGISRARRALQRMDPNALAAQQGARLTDANALPWLTGSTAGREFLHDFSPARVLVRGTPNERCPVALSKSGPAPIADLAAEALTQCLAMSERDCGCQVVAAGSVLMVPREDMNYATGVAARVRAPGLGLDGLLVAEEVASGRILLRDLSGVVGEIERGEGNSITVRFPQRDRVFTGRSIPVGFRRGRIAERVYATDDLGNRLSLLIGFGPDELAEFAGAWLAWPPDA